MSEEKIQALDAQAPLLTVRDLHVGFGEKEIVRGVNFSVDKSEVLAIVGESGSGKSVTALSIMGLLDPPGAITEGSIIYQGGRYADDPIDLATMKPKERVRYRGSEISMIFQEPTSAMNPVMSVGKQLIETIRIHGGQTVKEATQIAADWLDRVGLPEPMQQLRKYPHELSGGQLQRVMIAMALSGNPKLLIADEPTTALDVTTQAQILDLLLDLRDEHGLGMIFITHDLGVVAQIADQVAVMYNGRILENRDVFALFDNPLHPYTKALLETKPIIGDHRDRLSTITPEVRELASRPQETLT